MAIPHGVVHFIIMCNFCNLLCLCHVYLSNTLSHDIHVTFYQVSSHQRCFNINMEKKQRIVITGAGPTALGVAYRLYELGVLRSKTQVVILEQTSEAGGLASSYRDENGFLWDNGGHVIFSHYPYYDHVLNKAVPEWENHIRAAYAYMMGSSGKRRFVPYPVQNSIHLFDKEEQEKALKGLEEIVGHPKYKNVTNFDEWLVNNFGEGLCEVFMRKYNRKVWTVDPSEMNSLWMGERVAVPNVEAIKDKISRAKMGLKEAKDTKWGPNSYFRYPRYGGTGAIWKGVANLIPQGWFHYNKRLTKIDSNMKMVHVQDSSNSNNRQAFHYDYLISTAPLDILLQMISDPQKSKVSRNSTHFVHSCSHIIGIGLSGHPPDYLANKSWIYFPDSDSPFYRVTVLSNYADDMVSNPRRQWSLMCEVAQPKMSHDPAYEKENVIENTVTALVNYGFIKRERVISKYYRYLDHGYPVPFLKREELLRPTQLWLESRAIYSRGRFGGWRYEVGNQDHSFMQGVELADLIMLGLPEETYPNPNLVNSMKGSDRALSCTPPLPVGPELEFVVSRYRENLEWLDSYADHCHIYDKGGIAMNVAFHQWESLPNVGREAHTYLYHIITNYHHLADVTVFVQGSIKEHREFVYKNLSTYVEETKKKGFSFALLRPLRDWGSIHYVGKWRVERERGLMHPAKLETIGEFWESIFGSPHPDSALSSLCGFFGVSKHHILIHPKSFYESIISYVNTHVNPEEGHYLERIWPSIFSEIYKSSE